MTLAEEQPGSTVEWLELFFDLVVVVAVAVLTEGLREGADLGGLALFAVLYGAIWLSWISVVLYADIAREGTRVPTVVWAMFLVAVMAASAPAHYEQRANLFAGAFLLVRAASAQASMRTGRLLASWPLLQLGGVAAPWIVAMWVPVPAKFMLWGLGLVLDLLFVLLRNDDKDPEALLERLRRKVTRDNKRGSSARSESLQLVDVDAAHLSERLGLFVIIVLGEAVSQLVLPAAASTWSRDLVRPLLAGFLMLVGLWWLAFSYGVTSAPHTGVRTIRPRFALPMHLGATFGIVCLAAGLGALAAHPDVPLGGWMRWVMCGGLALYFLVTALGGLAQGAPRRWLLGWALPCTLLPLVIAAVDAGSHTAVSLGLLGCVAWMVAYRWVGRPRTAIQAVNTG